MESRVDAEERTRMVAEAAYFRAERRGFAGGDPVADWIEAEAEIDAALSAQGATLQVQSTQLYEHPAEPREDRAADGGAPSAAAGGDRAPQGEEMRAGRRGDGRADGVPASGREARASIGAPQTSGGESQASGGESQASGGESQASGSESQALVSESQASVGAPPVSGGKSHAAAGAPQTLAAGSQASGAPRSAAGAPQASIDAPQGKRQSSVRESQASEGQPEASTGEPQQKSHDELLARIEDGVAEAAKKVKALRKKAGGAETAARAEVQQQLDRIAELRDALETRRNEIRQQGAQASRSLLEQAESLWKELTAFLSRKAPVSRKQSPRRK